VKLAASQEGLSSMELVSQELVLMLFVYTDNCKSCIDMLRVKCTSTDYL
jgi:hypothetical protein